MGVSVPPQQQAQVKLEQTAGIPPSAAPMLGSVSAASRPCPTAGLAQQAAGGAAVQACRAVPPVSKFGGRAVFAPPGADPQARAQAQPEYGAERAGEENALNCRKCCQSFSECRLIWLAPLKSPVGFFVYAWDIFNCSE